ncbi:MAG: hypothetical protein WCI72_04700 [archaeon]
MTLTEADYKIAQGGGIFVRRDFVQSLDLDEYNVAEKIYFPLDRGYMTVNFPSPFSKPQMFFLSPAFEDPHSIFCSALYGHEVHHCRQIKEKPKEFWLLSMLRQTEQFQEYVSAVGEIPAYLNQLFNSPDWPLEGPLRMDTLEIVDILDITLKVEAEKLKRDWKKDLSGILCASPFDDVVRERYSL